MADGTKYHLISNTNFNGDLKAFLTTRRTKLFVYGALFVFVSFTVFLALTPSSTSYSPWFANFFSLSAVNTRNSSLSPPPEITGPASSSVFSDESYRSDFSSLSPNSSSRNYSSPSQDESFRSRNSTTLPNPKPDQGSPPPIPVNGTANSTSEGNKVVNANAIPPPSGPESPVINGGSNLTSDSGSSTGQEAKVVNTTETKSLKEKEVAANYTASLSKKPTNQKNYTEPSKGDWIGSLVNCDFYDGEWVRDDSYPLYKPGSCSLIDEQFNCFRNGRPDSDYQRLKWKPKRCTLPRLDGGKLLELLRGKRLAFVGDSLNRNMWESLVCILRNSVKNPKKVYEASGRVQFRTEASYSFVFEDYNCTVEFFASPFLVRQWEMKDKNGTSTETLRLDMIAESSNHFKTADVLVFNTGHWWTHEKTSLGKDYYQEGSHVYSNLDVVEAFRRALTTWARWVDANVNPSKTHVLYRGYSASHFSGGQWNSGGQCDSETEPIRNETYLSGYPWKMRVLETVFKGMKTNLSYMNVTRLTDYRKDGHPSVYRKLKLSRDERRSPLLYQDCSHWCLPGVPDAWNELLYAEVLRRRYQSNQA